MLKKLVNECRVQLAISPDGPIRIADGDRRVNRIGQMVKTNGQIYLPGSSLKGVFRSHLERIIRTINPKKVCELFGENGCSDKLQKRIKRDKLKKYPSDEAYKDSCAICKVFGNLHLSSRFDIDDAIGKNITTETRTNVAINRFTGGQQHGALLTQEVISGGTFETTIKLTNFEIWMLGLLSILLKSLSEQVIRVGHSTSRGLGKIKTAIKNFSIVYYGNTAPQNGLKGIGSFVVGGNYGFVQNDEINLENIIWQDKSYYFISEFDEAQRNNLFEKSMQKLRNYLGGE